MASHVASSDSLNSKLQHSPTISVLKGRDLSFWGLRKIFITHDPPEVQEQASSWMVTKVCNNGYLRGKEWKLTGKVPEAPPGVGAFLNLDLDLDGPPRCVPGKDFIKLYTKILPFMYLPFLKLGKIECLNLKSHSEDPHIEAGCPYLQSHAPSSPPPSQIQSGEEWDIDL